MILFFAFFSGVLSVLAPCVLPVLPVLLWGAATETNPKRSYLILSSALICIFSFTFLLKVWTGFIHLSEDIWNYLSWGIITIYGIFLLFPGLRDRIKSHFPHSKTVKTPQQHKTGPLAEIALGASLGPIFASCSPTYALIIGTILPQNLLMGTLSILFYVLGFWSILFIIIFFWREAIKRLKGYANSDWRFKKSIGILLIITGGMIISGGFKYLETKLLELPFSTALIKIEQQTIKTMK